MSDPVYYMALGGFSVVSGIALLVAGLKRRAPHEIITAEVTRTRARLEDADYEVFVSWTERDGQKKTGSLRVSTHDIPTRGSTIQIIPSLEDPKGLQLAKLKYRLTPGLWALIVGIVLLVAGSLDFTTSESDSKPTSPANQPLEIERR